jgi:hypothetical protein
MNRDANVKYIKFYDLLFLKITWKSEEKNKDHEEPCWEFSDDIKKLTYIGKEVY